MDVQLQSCSGFTGIQALYAATTAVPRHPRVSICDLVLLLISYPFLLLTFKQSVFVKIYQGINCTGMVFTINENPRKENVD